MVITYRRGGTHHGRWVGVAVVEDGRAKDDTQVAGGHHVRVGFSHDLRAHLAEALEENLRMSERERDFWREHTLFGLGRELTSSLTRSVCWCLSGTSEVSNVE